MGSEMLTADQLSVLEQVGDYLIERAMDSHRGSWERHTILCCVTWVGDFAKERALDTASQPDPK